MLTAGLSTAAEDGLKQRVRFAVSLVSPQFIDQLIKQHGAALVLFARQWCGDPDDAVQEALCDLTQLSSMPEDAVAWLYTATKRRALNQSRGDARRDRRNMLSAMQSSVECWFECEMERREEIDKLQWALEQLDPLDRQIVVTKIWGNLSFEQVAKIVEKPTTSVHRQYQAAIGKLRKTLENCHPQSLSVERGTASDG